MSIQRYDWGDTPPAVRNDEGRFVLFEDHEKAIEAAKEFGYDMGKQDGNRSEFHRGYRTGVDWYKDVALRYGKRKYEQAIRDCIDRLVERGHGEDAAYHLRALLPKGES